MLSEHCVRHHPLPELHPEVEITFTSNKKEFLGRLLRVCLQPSVVSAASLATGPETNSCFSEVPAGDSSAF